MSAYRFLTSPSLIHGNTAKIIPEDEHHALNVLRLKTEDQVELLDGQGSAYQAKVSSVRPLTFTFINKTHLKTKPETTIAIGLPKAKKADLIVRQLTEIGVGRIIFFTAKRSIPEVKGDKPQKKLDRWNKITRVAIKQSGNKYLPKMDLTDFTGLLDMLRSPAFVLYEGEGQKINECLAGVKNNVFLVIGPEGGLADEEIDLFKKKDAIICSLGENILRVETAAIYAATAIDLLINGN